MKGKNYELKIKSEASGTTIDLFTEQKMIDRWVSVDRTDKSDYLLESISMVLSKNKVDIDEIERIYFRKNNRSMTGYKIALSILKGISLIHGTEIVYED